MGDDRAAVAAGRGNLWRVKRRSVESLHIPYEGRALESGREYYWSVRVWDAAGRVSPWMPVNRFSTGLMTPDAWSGARWIAMEVQPDSLRLVPGEEYNKLSIGDRITATNKLPQFRREIDVRKPVKRPWPMSRAWDSSSSSSTASRRATTSSIRRGATTTASSATSRSTSPTVCGRAPTCWA